MPFPKIAKPKKMPVGLMNSPGKFPGLSPMSVPNAPPPDASGMGKRKAFSNAIMKKKKKMPYD